MEEVKDWWAKMFNSLKRENMANGGNSPISSHATKKKNLCDVFPYGNVKIQRPQVVARPSLEQEMMPNVDIGNDDVLLSFEIGSGYENLPNRTIPIKNLSFEQCQTCLFYHGKKYYSSPADNGTLLVCAIHPNGKDNCPDYEGNPTQNQLIEE
jgi:hypothetical protein